MIANNEDNASESRLEQSTGNFVSEVLKLSDPSHLSSLSVEEIEELDCRNYRRLVTFGSQLGKPDTEDKKKQILRIKGAMEVWRLNCARGWIRKALTEPPIGDPIKENELIEYVDEERRNDFTKYIHYLYARGKPEDIHLLQSIIEPPQAGHWVRNAAACAIDAIVVRHPEEDCTGENEIYKWLNDHLEELLDYPEGMWLAIDTSGVIAKDLGYAKTRQIARETGTTFVMYQVPFE